MATGHMRGPYSGLGVALDVGFAIFHTTSSAAERVVKAHHAGLWWVEGSE